MNGIALETKQLSLCYGKHQVLKNIDIAIEKNKITAIIGSSGCGKSTFLKALNRMTEELGGKTTGTVELSGHNYLAFSSQELRQKIGLVFQSPIAFPFSIYKNMTYAPLYYHHYTKEELNALVKKYLVKAGLYKEVKDILSLPATKLSGGQQQRLAIARALTVEPDIILLDEPCSALDAKNTLHIEQMLLDLRQDYTLVIVTHNLAQAKRIADTIVFMDNGEIIEVGSPEVLLTSPQSPQLKNFLSLN
ncbi:MAG: ATP-binding cassette domain-containing protein [Cellulosilyticaceae bacterium]